MEPGGLGAHPGASDTQAAWEQAKQPKQGEWEPGEERPLVPIMRAPEESEEEPLTLAPDGRGRVSMGRIIR